MDALCKEAPMWQTAVRFFKTAGPLLLVAAKLIEEYNSKAAAGLCSECGALLSDSIGDSEADVVPFAGNDA